MSQSDKLEKPMQYPPLTLPTDSAERKKVPMFSGCLSYFPAALAGVSRISKQGNDKHNPGQPLHHARGKSGDHKDCILRHMMDMSDLIAKLKRTSPGAREEILKTSAKVLEEASQMAWRALALSQELHEQLGEAPLAPGAKTNE